LIIFILKGQTSYQEAGAILSLTKSAPTPLLSSLASIKPRFYTTKWQKNNQKHIKAFKTCIQYNKMIQGFKPLM
jgi:hypothetical protein